MFNPQRDESGAVLPYDEPGLAPDDYVLRRINPHDYAQHVVLDEDTGAYRLSSGAFSRTSDDPFLGMSVDLEPSLRAAGESVKDYLPEGWGAVRIKVQAARELNFKVGADPILPGNKLGEPPNPHHGEIWGNSKRQHRQLLKVVDGWEVEIPGVALTG